MPLLKLVSAEQTLSIPSHFFSPSVPPHPVLSAPDTSSLRGGFFSSHATAVGLLNTAPDPPHRSPLTGAASRAPLAGAAAHTLPFGVLRGEALDAPHKHAISGGQAWRPRAATTCRRPLLPPHILMVSHAPAARPQATRRPGSSLGSNCPRSAEEDGHSWGWKQLWPHLYLQGRRGSRGKRLSGRNQGGRRAISLRDWVSGLLASCVPLCSWIDSWSVLAVYGTMDTERL
ncbi:hypothetical protein BS78_05G140600 [Paspalum vaginatum]|nr:hypothetical protein BS78_05G140600 [Paspalum vaginatum]KAJ1275504.1 hypothetical protein BS78_05G140600 [Paspalum vaginatum]